MLKAVIYWGNGDVETVYARGMGGLIEKISNKTRSTVDTSVIGAVSECLIYGGITKIVFAKGDGDNA